MSSKAPARIPIVDPPAGARIYSQRMRPLLGDCAPSGRIRLDALARWVQDIAHADMADAGLETAVVWVVRRTRILVRRFPRFGEALRVETFASGLARMCAERRTIVRPLGEGEQSADDVIHTANGTVRLEGTSGDGQGAGPLAGARKEPPLVQAVTLWIHLDPVRLLPTALRPGVYATYGATAADRKFSHRLFHPKQPDAIESEGEWVFRHSDLDIAAHVNNAAYWEAIEEELLSHELDPQSIDAEVEYRLPAQPGRVKLKRGHGYIWLTDPRSGELYASMRVTQPDA